ncbi:hypothetical protein [Pseudomonas svalbardensis]|uniref:hypothetical protein n=1 Tax=Pseudomonas svalbardensis TaxID=3042029 RepID=UPI0024B35EE4|nr:hypothetical protein [Pseudomonas sp. PMCC200367]
MTIKISQLYHPAGHGTFHTGTAWGKKHGMFRWAYDCGSKRKKHLSNLIDDLTYWSPRWRHGAAVDLLVLSHFDDDHVNGVELFLKTWKVKWLALPYTHLSQKLENVSDHGGASCSASTALLQLDPKQWLAARGLEGQVMNILEIKGGSMDDPDEHRASDIDRVPPKIGPNELPYGNEKRSVMEREYGTWHADSELDIFAKPNSESNTKSNHSPKFYSMNHHQAFRALNSNLEFMFYNSDAPTMCTLLDSGKVLAKRSKSDMDEVSRQIQDIVKQYRIGFTNEQPKTNWRKKLRYVYDHHFGKSSKKRNNISLCLYVRPICDYPCAYNDWKGEFEDRYSSLSLGDLTVNPYTLNSLKSHLGFERWESLATVQVPHHGSRHSWHQGAADVFAASYFIQCVPNSSSYHPHKEVKIDLKGHVKLFANYRVGAGSFFKLHDIYDAAPGNINLNVQNWRCPAILSKAHR